MVIALFNLYHQMAKGYLQYCYVISLAGSNCFIFYYLFFEGLIGITWGKANLFSKHVNKTNPI